MQWYFHSSFDVKLKLNVLTKLDTQTVQMWKVIKRVTIASEVKENTESPKQENQIHCKCWININTGVKLERSKPFVLNHYVLLCRT